MTICVFLLLLGDKSRHVLLTYYLNNNFAGFILLDVDYYSYGAMFYFYFTGDFFEGLSGLFPFVSNLDKIFYSWSSYMFVCYNFLSKDYLVSYVLI